MNQDTLQALQLPGGCAPARPGPAAALTQPEEEAFQAAMLLGVSRTFALTIPQLPGELCRQVSNAYLLCRIVDTIEDEPALSAAQKQTYCQRFVEVVRGREDSARFAADLAPLLSGQTLPAERELIRDTPTVIAITHGFAAEVRQALEDCVRIMADGMVDFQLKESAHGLAALADLHRYCYHVAGVVGEMLTRLFCLYSPAIAARRDALMTRAVSFGQGLQMTNILKDVWEDYRRGACWLPRECFAAEGFSLADLGTGQNREAFNRGLTRLIGIAHAHLRRALEYTLLLPPDEPGLRNFCLWALGMAVLTLRKIDRHRDYTQGVQVKISRRSVKGVVLATRLTVRHDWMLKMLFRLAGRSLPIAPLTSPPDVAGAMERAHFH